MTSRYRFGLRGATLEDLETLVQHRRAMWESMGVMDQKELAKADRNYRRWARERLKDRTLRGWVVTSRDGTPVGSGCLWLQPVQPRPGRVKVLQPYLLSMYTVPAYRGKGLASKIVREATKWTGRNGYASLRLHASEMGRGVYKKLGFERTWEMRLSSPKR